MDFLVGLSRTLQSCDPCAGLSAELRDLEPRDAMPSAATVRAELLSDIFSDLVGDDGAEDEPEAESLASAHMPIATGAGGCCIRQGLSPVLMPLPGLAPVSPYFGMRPVGRLSLPK